MRSRRCLSFMRRKRANTSGWSQRLAQCAGRPSFVKLWRLDESPGGKAVTGRSDGRGGGRGIRNGTGTGSVFSGSLPLTFEVGDSTGQSQAVERICLRMERNRLQKIQVRLNWRSADI